MTTQGQSLSDQYRKYFNKRGADIEGIWDKDGEMVIRYHDGHTVPIPNVRTWVGLFEKLEELHPRPKP